MIVLPEAPLTTEEQQIIAQEFDYKLLAINVLMRAFRDAVSGGFTFTGVELTKEQKYRYQRPSIAAARRWFAEGHAALWLSLMDVPADAVQELMKDEEGWERALNTLYTAMRDHDQTGTQQGGRYLLVDKEAPRRRRRRTLAKVSSARS